VAWGCHEVDAAATLPVRTWSPLLRSDWARLCRDGSVTLAEGETKTCTITTTTSPPPLSGEDVVNDDGGDAVVDDFQAYIDGGAVAGAATRWMPAATLPVRTWSPATPPRLGHDCAATAA